MIVVPLIAATLCSDTVARVPAAAGAARKFVSGRISALVGFAILASVTAASVPFPRRHRRWVWLAGGLIVVAALAAYHHSFRGALLLDDRGSITGNATIRRLCALRQILAIPQSGRQTEAVAEYRTALRGSCPRSWE